MREGNEGRGRGERGVPGTETERPGKLCLGLACVIFVYARSIALYCVGEGMKVTAIHVEVKQLMLYMPYIRLMMQRKLTRTDLRSLLKRQ